jgi:hypothetical protein
MQYLSRACPVCNSKDVEKNTIHSKVRSEELMLDDIRPYWRGFFKDKIFFTYYRCSLCSLLYSKKFFTKDQIDDLYSNMPDNTAGLSVEILEKTQDAYYRLIKKYIDDDGSYLELGPDIGLFTKKIVNNHQFQKTYLKEPNKEVWSCLKGIDSNQKILISASTDDYGDIDDLSLSLVVMIHGPDHFLNPKELLSKLKSKLKKGATIVFVNHNESSLIAKISSSNWPAYCMQHPQLFNPRSITELFESSGFDVKKIYKTKNYFPVAYLIKHGLWAIGFKVNFNFNDNFVIGLKLGNIMTIATLKSKE